MHYVYVLMSEVNDRLYIGVTDDISKRLIEHNLGKTRSTKPHRPYRLIYSECYQMRSKAFKRERQIKIGRAHV